MKPETFTFKEVMGATFSFFITAFGRWADERKLKITKEDLDKIYKFYEEGYTKRFGKEENKIDSPDDKIGKTSL